MFLRLVFLAAVLLLAACSGPRLPFEKEQPLAGSQADIVRPPWEALVQAGPNADKDLDLETLNGPAAAAEPVPGQTAVIQLSPETEPEIVAPKPAKPKPKKNAVAIRAVALLPVEGAKAAGGAELTRAMRQVLREAGWTVVNSQQPDALTIRGRVKMMVSAGDSQTVKLDWLVATPDGKKLGDIGQSNVIPKGSLDQGWGENARFATEAAAEGIFKLIQAYR
jgi:hypothetical protein